MSTKLEVGLDGVAIITLINPPVNALALTVLEGLKDNYDEALRRSDVKAIVVTGAGGKFCGGFDITAIQAIQKKGAITGLADVSIELMSKTIEDAQKPSVAAIEGLALGGGLELAMACHARVATPKAQLGLPELQLGVIPGFGGTQRLPRMVGLTKAIEMILLSKSISSEEGKDLGLVDVLVPPNELLSAACKLAVEIAEHRKPWLSTLYRTDKLESLGKARDIIKIAREQANKTASHLLHPHACLDAIEEGVVNGGYAGLLKERSVFQEAMVSDTSKALVHVFFAQRATSKVAGITDLNLKPRAVKKVGVIGGGLMGSGIATALILSNISVVLKEVNADFLQNGIDKIKANLDSRLRKGNLSKDKFDKAMSLLKGTLVYDDFSTVDLVIEAVIESVPLKQQIFVDLERICSPSAILATNTSTISLNVIGENTSSQNRIIGAHFFSPAHVMPLLEIIKTENTSPQAVVDLLNLGKIIKKVPVVVRNCTGFAVNRVFFPYTQAATMLVDLGVDVYRVDTAIKAFGMPMGPFRLADLIGFGASVLVGGQFLEAYPDRSYASQLFHLMFQDKRLGESSKKGFYFYDEKRKAYLDPEIKEYMEKSRKAANIMPHGMPIQVSDKDIVEMILFPVVNEASRVLHEGIVGKASDLDIASVLGMGFPSYRGGIVFWADSVGTSYIHSKLNEWSESYGDFFKPSSFLEERARKGLSLSAPSNATATGARL